MIGDFPDGLRKTLSFGWSSSGSGVSSLKSTPWSDS